MWTRHDYAVLAAAAVATFSLTLAGFWPRVASAVEDPSVTEMVTMPTLQFDGCEVFAQVAKADDVTAGVGNTMTIKPGAVPTIQLVLKNMSETERTLTFNASFTEMSLQSMFSRRPVFNAPSWTDSYSVMLKGGESKTIEISTGAKLDAGLIGNLTLTGRPEVVAETPNGGPFTIQKSIVALQMNTPAALRTNGASARAVEVNGTPVSQVRENLQVLTR